jgi:hypothetical protein
MTPEEAATFYRDLASTGPDDTLFADLAAANPHQYNAAFVKVNMSPVALLTA